MVSSTTQYSEVFPKTGPQLKGCRHLIQNPGKGSYGIGQLEDGCIRSFNITRYLQVEIEALKSDCANAQLECNAADGRAKLLASDAIGLEDKAEAHRPLIGPITNRVGG
ncbi:BLISTER-like isoform X1 [Olea europaea subsp. europaea]|uniref:BLISTER-like isoform X1 n=1 Tax=Olea europaea subsp. europaea TaxID=158383 RepID=A0A8S0RBW8_OLEEU|nr:BLISTER-like isoform X1 [Olea europaea subsp. europaea]